MDSAAKYWQVVQEYWRTSPPRDGHRSRAICWVPAILSVEMSAMSAWRLSNSGRPKYLCGATSNISTIGP
jgi:hypothetical protein